MRIDLAGLDDRTRTRLSRLTWTDLHRIACRSKRRRLEDGGRLLFMTMLLVAVLNLILADLGHTVDIFAVLALLTWPVVFVTWVVRRVLAVAHRRMLRTIGYDTSNTLSRVQVLAYQGRIGPDEAAQEAKWDATTGLRVGKWVLTGSLPALVVAGGALVRALLLPQSSALWPSVAALVCSGACLVGCLLVTRGAESSGRDSDVLAPLCPS